jgi:hypothetical protein
MRAALASIFLSMTLAGGTFAAEPAASTPEAPATAPPMVDIGILVRACEAKIGTEINDRLLREADLMTRIAALQKQIASLQHQAETQTPRPPMMPGAQQQRTPARPPEAPK